LVPAAKLQSGGADWDEHPPARSVSPVHPRKRDVGLEAISGLYGKNNFLRFMIVSKPTEGNAEEEGSYPWAILAGKSMGPWSHQNESVA
jgi:hypothetical protein